MAILLIATIAWVARNKRTQHRRVEAGDIRDKAAEQSHKVGQREALADETAAKGRAAQAEADAKAAHATGLQHQAEMRRSDAATARDEVNQEFERADTIDPDTHTNGDTPRQDPETRETPRGTPPASKAHPRCPDPGDVANPRTRTWPGHRRPTPAVAAPSTSGPAVRRVNPPTGACTSHATSRTAALPLIIPPAG